MTRLPIRENYAMRRAVPVFETTSPFPKRNFWQRRVLDPVLAQLTQGITPEKIALTIAIGSAIAMFPILGTTTMLCLLVGIFLKLNQPIIQAVNFLCTPLHLTFIYYSVRWGERLFGIVHSRLEFRVMMQTLRQHPIDFVRDFWVAVLHACVVWAILAPFWAFALYYVLLPVLREANRVRIAAAVKAAEEKAKDHPVP
jgi:uncharacterized protein (DUF2062 family)